VRWAKNKKHRVSLSFGSLVLSIFLYPVLLHGLLFNFSMLLSVSYTWR